MSISLPVYWATIPSTRGGATGFRPRAFASRPSASQASSMPLYSPLYNTDSTRHSGSTTESAAALFGCTGTHTALGYGRSSHLSSGVRRISGSTNHACSAGRRTASTSGTPTANKPPSGSSTSRKRTATTRQ